MNDFGETTMPARLRFSDSLSDQRTYTDICSLRTTPVFLDTSAVKNPNESPCETQTNKLYFDFSVLSTVSWEDWWTYDGISGNILSYYYISFSTIRTACLYLQAVFMYRIFDDTVEIFLFFIKLFQTLPQMFPRVSQFSIF